MSARTGDEQSTVYGDRVGQRLGLDQCAQRIDNIEVVMVWLQHVLESSLREVSDETAERRKGL